jgi:WD40 repeat protein
MLWDIATQQAVGQPLAGHDGEVWDVAFSPDSKTLVSAGAEDRRVILWDVDSRQELGLPLANHGDWVTSVAFSPDGQTLASGSLDKSVLLWTLSLEAWEERACQTANRSLTESEWARYFQNQPYLATCG